METRELVCGNCGAINRASAGPCWRCFEPLERPGFAGASTEIAKAIHGEELGRVRICSRCGAEASAEAPFCWKCQAPFTLISKPVDVNHPRQLASFASGVAAPRAKGRAPMERRFVRYVAIAAAAAGLAWLLIPHLS